MCILLKEKNTIYKCRLKDYTLGLFHIVGPECQSCIKKGLKHLSYEARISRFNYPIKEFSSVEIDYLTKLDQVNHFALGAGMCHISKDPGMGIARYIRIAEDSDIAEIAITVLDKYQNKGLGTILLSLLMRYAHQNSIGTFCGYADNNNSKIRHIFEKFNGNVKGTFGNLLYMELDIVSNLQQSESLLKEYAALESVQLMIKIN